MGAYPTTHIANGCPYPIFAMCDTDRQHVLTGSVEYGGVGVVVKNTATETKATTAGFTKISPGSYLGFKPKVGIGGANWFNRNTVYITIVYERDGERHDICEAFPRATNESVIVAHDCTICPTKMGELWIDRTGKNHKP